MPLTAIDHVQLAMPPGGEGEAAAFYQDLLGLTETPKPPHLAMPAPVVSSHRWGPGSATVGMNGGRRLGAEKSSTEATFLAAVSRLVSGARPHRHSTILRIDVWSNTVWATRPERANGDTTYVG